MEKPNPSSGIKSWAEDDRPREKLQLKGKAALSDAELIAILLGSGSRNETAVELAKKILLSANHDLNRLGKLSIEELTQFKGVGTAKAINIITALEVGKRRRLSQAEALPRVTNSADLYELIQPILGDLPHEEFWVIFLNNHNRVLAKKCISKGGLTGTMADTRLIFKEALLLNSTSIVLVHNHPSGNLKPSRPDQLLTKKLKDAGQVMDVPVLDHIIVTDVHYFSFADEGLM